MSRPQTDPGRGAPMEEPSSFLPDLPRAGMSNAGIQPQPPASDRTHSSGRRSRNSSTPALAFVHEAKEGAEGGKKDMVARLQEKLHQVCIQRDEAQSNLRATELLCHDAQHASMMDRQSALAAQGRVGELQNTLKSTEASWKALFDRSNDEMEMVLANVAQLESEIDEGVTNAMRTESVQKLHAMETAALKEELQRSNVAHSQTKDRLETLYNDSAASTRNHQALKTTLDTENRELAARLDTFMAQLQATQQEAEDLRRKLEQQEQQCTEAVASQQNMSHELESANRALREKDLLISEANVALQLSEDKIATQAARLREDNLKLGETTSYLQQTQLALKRTEKERLAAVKLSHERDGALQERHSEISDQLKESMSTSEAIQKQHGDLGAECVALKKELRISNDKCKDMSHEVQYLLAELSKSKADVSTGTGTAAPLQEGEQSSAGTTVPVWQDASVKLGRDDVSRDDAIIRMKVIEWGSMAVDAGCQTEVNDLDVHRELHSAQSELVHTKVGMLELEKMLREKGCMSEIEIAEIIGFPCVEVGRDQVEKAAAIALEHELRACGKWSEMHIMKMIGGDGTDLLLQHSEGKKADAATVIQTFWRSFSSRRRTRAYVLAMQNKAAVTIQARARGKQGRALAQKHRRLFVSTETQTDVVNIAELAIDPALREPKGRLEKELRESGKFSEVEIVQLLDPEAVAGVILSANGPKASKTELEEELEPVLPNPELLEAETEHEAGAAAVERLRALLQDAGVASSAMNEYLVHWVEDGVDDGILDVWSAGVISSNALEEDFGIRSVGDRYKILGALKALPQGGIVAGSDRAKAPASTRAPSSATTIPSPDVMVVRGPPDVEMHAVHEVLKGNFDSTKSKMKDLLTTHFEAAIREKDGLISDLATERERTANLSAQNGELKDLFNKLLDSKNNVTHQLKNAESAIQSLESKGEEQSDELARKERVAMEEARHVADQMTVMSSKLTAERLEKEQFKILVDKVGQEIIKEKNEDMKLMDQLTQERARAKADHAQMQDAQNALSSEVRRLNDTMKALQDSLNTKEEFAKRLEQEKADLISLRDTLLQRLTEKSTLADEKVAESSKMREELDQATETYRERLTEQRKQIKQLEDDAREQQARNKDIQQSMKDTEEKCKALIESKVTLISDLQQNLDSTTAEKDKVSKNCFAQMSKLNDSLQTIHHMKAEYEVALQVQREQADDIQGLQDTVTEVSSERDDASAHLQELANSVSRERQLYQEAKAENSVYSNAVKRLELQVFQTNMQKEDAVNKVKAKMRAMAAEKESISTAYLKVTGRLGEAKDREIAANQKMIEAMRERDDVFNDIDALKSGKARVEGDVASLKKQLKSTEKARKKAEQNMRLANQRATEMEEILAAKVRQLGQKIFAMED